MSGRMSAEWWRAYRARNKEKLNLQQRARRAVHRDRGDRSEEYRKAWAKTLEQRYLDNPDEFNEALLPLYPHLHHGTGMAFYEDELRMDLEQEKQLAILEGRDPDEAAREYKRREKYWFHVTVPYAPLTGDLNDDAA